MMRNKNNYMLLRKDKRPNESVVKISVSPDLANQQNEPISIPYRNAFTAKLKSRHSSQFIIKPTSIKPYSSTSTYINLAESQNDFRPQDQTHSLKNSHNLALFDNMQLQDFLKMAIVGQGQGIQTKSKEIIKSLNGTWFKNTHSKDLSTYKLCNSLGIKRAKMQYKLIKQEKQPQNYRQIFKNQYTPRNIFPMRKLSPRRYPVSKNTQGSLATSYSQIIERSSPLKESVQRQTNQSKKPLKRSNTPFSSKMLKNTNLFQQTGFLLGRKIVLHNQDRQFIG